MMSYQRGVTLIELMISLTLSLSLIAGIGSLFTQMQKTNQLQRAVSNVMDDSRYALEILQKEIRYAGGLRSKDDRNGTAALVFPALDPLNVTQLGSTAPFGFAAGEYIQGDLSNPAPTNDSFMLRYQLVDASDLNNSSSSPCTQSVLVNTGSEDPAVDNHVVTVYFYINGGVLMCTAQRVIVDTSTGVSVITCIKNCALTDTPVSLISNVAKLAVSYGVDSDAVEDQAANYYVSALNVTPATLWPRVKSIRLSLVLKSAETNLASTIVPYKVDGVSVTPTDKSLYRAFSSTIALRNQIQG